MIILPAIPAIIAALTPLAKAALVSAGIGAVVGGATCAATGAVTGYHEHGELNRNVAASTAHQAAECAGEGALVGGLFGGAGFVIAPAFGTAATVVDDVARPIIQVADDVAHPVLQAADDTVRPAIQTLDDAAAPVMIGLDDAANSTKKSTSRITSAIASPWNRALNSFRARIYKLLPPTKVGAKDGWVYVIKDPKTGMTKIGVTSDPKQRLSKLQKDLGNKGVKYDCIIHSHDKNALENNLHQNFSNLQKNHPIPHSGMTEWFVLTGAQVAYACSH